MTIDDVLNRLYRNYLDRADDRGLDVRLDGAVTSGDTQLVVHLSELTPEEQALLAPGVILELDDELVRVQAVDEAAQTLTVQRAMSGTTAAAHSDGTLISVAPRYPRVTAFEYVSDSIRELYPDLYAETYTTEWWDEFIPVNVTGAVEVLEAKSGTRGLDVQGYTVKGRTDLSDTGIVYRVFPFHQDTTEDVLLKVKVRPVRPTATTDQLSDLNVDDDWVDIIVVSAAAKMLPGQEIDRTTIEYLTEAIEAQGIGLGDQFNLAAAMLSLRETLMQRAQAALTVDQGMRVEYDRVI